MAIDNIFDFIDELERQNFTPGTANENRYFVFKNLELGINATDNPHDLQSAFEAVGVVLPQRAFDRIFDSVAGNQTEATIIQHMAGNSLIPDAALPLSDYQMSSAYRVYSEVPVHNTLTGQDYVMQWAHDIEDLTTPDQLRQEIAESIETHYTVSVQSIALLRIYKSNETQ